MNYFSESYKEARNKIINLAQSKGATVESLPIQGEEYSIDVIKLGADDSKNKMLITSGVHGVEGFVGSAVQLAWLEQLTIPLNVQVIIIHVINPYGMDHNMRWNKGNIDLNRNFWNELPVVDASPYSELDSFLNPTKKSQLSGFKLKALKLIMKHGFNKLKQVVAQGQYHKPSGIFYGGNINSPNTLAIKNFFQSDIFNEATVFGIDLHCGLGKFGELSFYLEGLFSSHTCDTLSTELNSPIIHVRSEGKTSYQINGGFIQYLSTVVPTDKLFMLTAEFGTYKPTRILKVLREDNFYRNQTSENGKASLRVKEAFCPNDNKWKGLCIKRGLVALNSMLNLAEKSDSKTMA